MVEMHSKYDNININRIFNALNDINNHVNSCINCMLSCNIQFFDMLETSLCRQSYFLRVTFERTLEKFKMVH